MSERDPACALAAEPVPDPPAALPAFIPEIVAQLRRRRVQVGIADVQAVRLALRAGFGLASRDELRELCVHLWAKSPAEAEVVRAAFANLAGADLLAEWGSAGTAEPAPGTPDSLPRPGLGEADGEAGSASADAIEMGTEAGAKTGFVWQLNHDLDLGGLRTGAVDHGLVLVPQYPMTSREVAQAWRHLRRPVRSGPAVELDIDATVAERARRGVATPPVLVPRRRNAVRLLMLIDRQGSMTPFHGYVDYVVGAIRDAGRIDDVQTVYFHDVPGSLADKAALEEMPDPFRPDLDDVLALIEPLRDGRMYDDVGLTVPRPLDRLLAGLTSATAVLVISDAGAARRQFDIARLADTIALVKALRAGSAGVAWLNPVPRDRWPRTTAVQVARHVPMFPFTRQGLYQAVDALRGRPVLVERPV
jgi:uncharacterized protein with von Willebrand factor type A (vWA) domain